MFFAHRLLDLIMINVFCSSTLGFAHAQRFFAHRHLDLLTLSVSLLIDSWTCSRSAFFAHRHLDLLTHSVFCSSAFGFAHAQRFFAHTIRNIKYSETNLAFTSQCISNLVITRTLRKDG